MVPQRSAPCTLPAVPLVRQPLFRWTYTFCTPSFLTDRLPHALLRGAAAAALRPLLPARRTAPGLNGCTTAHGMPHPFYRRDFTLFSGHIYRLYRHCTLGSIPRTTLLALPTAAAYAPCRILPLSCYLFHCVPAVFFSFLPGRTAIRAACTRAAFTILPCVLSPAGTSLPRSVRLLSHLPRRAHRTRYTATATNAHSHTLPRLLRTGSGPLPAWIILPTAVRAATRLAPLPLAYCASYRSASHAGRTRLPPP